MKAQEVSLLKQIEVSDFHFTLLEYFCCDIYATEYVNETIFCVHRFRRHGVIKPVARDTEVRHQKIQMRYEV